MKKFIYIVMAAGLLLAGVSANAAPAKKTTAKTAKSVKNTKAAAPKARVKATTKFVMPQHTLSAKEKSAYTYYMKALNNYSDGKAKAALQELDLCDKNLGYATARTNYLRAKIAYETGDYATARNASESYFNSNPIHDNGFEEMKSINNATKAYFSQQEANKEAAAVEAQAAAAKAAADKKAAAEKLQEEIAAARAKREEARKNRDAIVKKVEADLNAARQANTRAAYQEFIQNHPFGRARLTAEQEMNEKWPYPTRTLKSNKYGFVDKNGKFVVKAKYDNAASFEEDLARVGKAGLYGFVNEQGKEVIPLKYRNASDFSYGYAAVKEPNGAAYFIDKTGKRLGNDTYKDVRAFSEGLAPVSNKAGLYGYIDNKGNQPIGFQYNTASQFSGMRAVVGRKDGKVMKYGYIKKDGSPLTECIFDEAQNFQFGMARIKQNGKYGLIDWNGSPLTPVVYDYITEYRSDGYARARRNGIEVLIDRNGDTWSEVNGNIVPVKFKN